MSAEPDTTEMRVLVADDDASSRLVLRAAVERLGFECLVATDGDDAWRQLQEFEPDVLITDWMMPGLDGPELCRRARQRSAESYTYVILATALGEHKHVLEGMEAGADDYLTKPISPFDVRARLVAAKRVTQLHKELERLHDALAEQARTDPLTMLGNRLRLHEDLSGFQDRAERYGQSYAVAICDLDEFKRYNDTHGHLAGDEALRRVAKVIESSCRAGDGAYRYGGEEFLIIYSSQDLDSALVAADRMRATVEALGLESPAVSRDVMTISVGVAAWSAERADTPDSVLSRADAALYRCKDNGRNCVAGEDPEPATDRIVT